MGVLIKNKMMILGTLLVVMTLVLSGCQADVSETYLVNRDDVSTKITFKAKGDKVYQQIAESQLSYDALAVLNEEQAKKKMAERSADYQNIDGLKYDIKYENEMVIETVTIDYTKDNLAGLAEADGLFISSRDVKNAISLKGTTEMLLDNGAIKVEDETQ